MTTAQEFKRKGVVFKQKKQPTDATGSPTANETPYFRMVPAYGGPPEAVQKMLAEVVKRATAMEGQITKEGGSSRPRLSGTEAPRRGYGSCDCCDEPLTRDNYVLHEDGRYELNVDTMITGKKAPWRHGDPAPERGGTCELCGAAIWKLMRQVGRVK